MKKRLQLIEARKKLNMSTRELAKQVGVSNSMITQIENCRCRPSIDLAFKLEDFFGIPARELLAITKIEEKVL